MSHQFLKVHYASVVDWCWKVDILRANLDFHNHPHYDFALVQVTPDDNKYTFVQLVYIFQVRLLEKTLSLALVHPFDAPLLRNQSSNLRDHALRIKRLHPQRRLQSVIIDVNTIVCGGLLAPDLESRGGEHLVIDVIDEDLWKRLKVVEFVTNAWL